MSPKDKQIIDIWIIWRETMSEPDEKIDNKKAEKVLKKGYPKAKQLLRDQDKVEGFLQKLEKKLRTIPFIGGKLADISVMASLLNSYVHKEYTSIPFGSIVAVVSALIYFVSPIDIIPDFIPGVGHIDDALVIAACWRLVKSDLKEYLEWRENNNKTERI